VNERDAVEVTVEIGSLEVVDAVRSTSANRVPLSLHEYLSGRGGV
jgi:hypothetical protein